jgi:hypothetical protein
LIPLPKLETSFRDLTDEKARLAYAESALAARVLFERAGGSLAFLLQDLGEGMSFGQALQGRAFISQEEFQTEWVQRIR